MAKIDRLGWADGIAFIAYGLRVGVRVSRGDLLNKLTERLPPGWKHAHGQVVDHLYSLVGGGADRRDRVRRLNLAYWNLTRIARSRTLDDMLDAFESHLQLTVAEHAPRRVFVHSGVVGWKGKAILFPGLSH